MPVMPKGTRDAVATRAAVTLAMLVASVIPFEARAGEAEARRLLKAMSDFLAAQPAIALGFATTFSVDGVRQRPDSRQDNRHRCGRARGRRTGDVLSWTRKVCL